MVLRLSVTVTIRRVPYVFCRLGIILIKNQKRSNKMGGPLHLTRGIRLKGTYGGTSLVPGHAFQPDKEAQWGGSLNRVKLRLTAGSPPQNRNHLQRRSDMLYNVKDPSKGTSSAYLAANFSTTNFDTVKKSGVRPANEPSTLGKSTAHNYTQQFHLVKKCKDCYFFRDAIYEYNFCTQHNTHMQRKTTPAGFGEGYRPEGGKGGKHIHRKNAFKLPIHRLGTPFPKVGNRKEYYGNPEWGNFDRWFVIRRLRNIGKPSDQARYGFRTYFFDES